MNQKPLQRRLDRTRWAPWYYLTEAGNALPVSRAPEFRHVADLTTYAVLRIMRGGQ